MFDLLVDLAYCVSECCGDSSGCCFFFCGVGVGAGAGAGAGGEVGWMDLQFGAQGVHRVFCE